jgi:hypothetical protein
MSIPGAIAWAFPAAGAAGLAIATAARERIAKTLAIAATIAVGLAWAVSRGVPWIAPRPALPLTLAAVGVALLIGAAAEGFVPSLEARSFGAFHLGFGALALYAVAASVVGAGFLARGHLDGLRSSGDLIPAFFSSEARQLGDFRVLWLGGTSRVLRADLTGPQGETVLTYGARRAGAGERYMETAVESILARLTEQGGRILSPLGVRYIVLRPGADNDVERALARQVDLRFAQRFRGTQILENQAWLPVGGAVSSPRWVAASLAAPDDAAVAVASAPLDPGSAGAFHVVRPGRFEGVVLPAARSLLLAEEFSDAWRAQTSRGSLGPNRSFGWATSFPLAGVGGGRVVVSWGGQGWHRLALLAELLLFAAVGIAWSRRSAFERGER